MMGIMSKATTSVQPGECGRRGKVTPHPRKKRRHQTVSDLAGATENRNKENVCLKNRGQNEIRLKKSTRRLSIRDEENEDDVFATKVSQLSH